MYKRQSLCSRFPRALLRLAGSAGILNVPLEEFEEFKSHSLSVRTPSGRKTDLKQAPVRGLGTPNGGIVVFDKTSVKL